MRPTIALALIVKNEQKNIPGLFNSIAGCYDEIHITDTGSTDRTISILEELKKEHLEKFGTKIVIKHFEWCNDFAKARNFSFDNISTDYIGWKDADDILSDREAFIKFRDNALEHADYWFATYDYASDDKGNPKISFVRERIVKNSLKLEWKYFLHEGIPPAPGIKADYITTWKVVHKRTLEDIEKDKNRNLAIFEHHLKTETLDPRMTYYYGKELFEAGKLKEALAQLLTASCEKSLEVHDRLLAIQYASYCAIQLDKFSECRQLCYQGIQLDPKRAEFYITIADSFLKQGKMLEALPSLNAAKKCIGNPMPGGKYAGAIFSHPDAYTTYPRNAIARVLFNMGDFDGALIEAEECHRLYKDKDSKDLVDEVGRVKKLAFINENAEQTEDIVITCPPMALYEWDEGNYSTRGLGGSETAAVEMAKWLHIKTNRPVKIFNVRATDYTSTTGVEYYSTDKLNNYFSRFKPYVHIAWRHNIPITTAPTYLWCHDLLTPTVESKCNFDYILCLSEFHKRFVMARQGVPENKIIVTRNGVEPKRFYGGNVVKNENKIVWSSSPDRGLDSAISVIEESRKTYPELELHVFYGLDNMKKLGMNKEVEHYENLFKSKPWIKYHGNVPQKELTKHISDAVVWLYPTNFLETYCITAIEMLLSKVFPIVRKYGALQDTLNKPAELYNALIIDSDCRTKEEIKVWSDALDKVLATRPWVMMTGNPYDYSWEGVAEEWIKILKIESKTEWRPFVEGVECGLVSAPQ